MSRGPRKEEWKLTFERRFPLQVEPLMGWTEDRDPLAQVELSFSSAEAAIGYARRNGPAIHPVGTNYTSAYTSTSAAHDGRAQS